MYLQLISIIFSSVACTERVSIIWNASTDIGHSRNERLYEYPMFTDIAPSPCDLTAAVCDIGCCVDPDCDPLQKLSFNCSVETQECARPLSKYDCNCPFERPFWFSALCCVFKNPIYLGLFFKTPSKIEDWKMFMSLKSSNSFQYETVEDDNGGKSYKVGSPVLSYILQNGSFTPHPHALLLEKNLPTGYSCNVAVKYLQDSIHSCYVRLTKELCENEISLSARNYLVRNENSLEAEEIPLILKNLETEEAADVNITLKYSSSKLTRKQFRGKLYKYFLISGELHEYNNDINLFKTFWNGTHCCNVIAKAIFHFITNSTEINYVNIQFILTNVSLIREKFRDEFVYLKKHHVVSFRDISANKESDLRDNYVFNRGYYEGENLSFGFNRTNGSHMYWEKGHLKTFLNGRACNRSVNVTFGYDSYSKCFHRSELSNCSSVREEVELILDSLVRGEFLAPYGNYRLPHRPAIPLLRNYNRPERSDLNATECFLPTEQDIYVQYTTTNTPQGSPIHRAVGLMVDRTFAEVNPVAALPITTRAIFVQVGAVEEKPLSRFWQKVYSPERSENSWLNMFRVMNHPLTEDELEESVFWLLLPPAVTFAVLILLRDNR